MPTLVACLAIVMTVGLQERAVYVGPRWKPGPRFRPREIRVEPFGMNAGLPESQPIDFWPSWTTWALAALLALPLLVLAVRWIRRRTRPVPKMTAVRSGADSGVLTEANAQILQSGLAAAIQILSSGDRDLGNAVVQAWQGLQDAAAAAGLHRRPAETASEFTARILYRSRGSAEAIAVLLSLYQRVRFGEHYPTADEIDAARHSVDVLVGLWQADFPKRRQAPVAR